MLNVSIGTQIPWGGKNMKTAWWKLVIVVVVAVVIAGAIASQLAKRADEKQRTPDFQAQAKEREEALLKQEANIKGPLERVEIPATEAEFSKQSHEFFRRITVQSYEKYGNKSVKWDDAAVELLELTAARLAQVEDEPTDKELLAAAEKVMATDCDDQLVSVAIGLALLLDGRPNEARIYAYKVNGQQVARTYTVTKPDGSVSKRTSSGPIHSYYISFLGNLVGGRACAAIGGSELQSKAASYEVAINALASGLTSEKMEPGDDRVIVVWVMRALCDWLDGSADKLVEKLTDTAGVDPWVKAVLLGQAEIRLAWKNRGDGWASTVTEEGWKGFRSHLALARSHLVRAWEFRPEYPEAPALMITVVGGGDVGQGETGRVWFDRAVAAQFDYMRAYTRHMWFLRPRWGGSHEAMYSFGQECAATKRFDTCVPGMLYAAAQAVGEERYEQGADFWRKPGVYGELVSTFKGMLAEPDGPCDVKRTKTRWAASAWRAGEYKEAGRLLAGLGCGIRMDVLRSDFGTTVREIRGDIAVQTSGQAKAVAAALADGEQHPGRAAATLRALRNSLPGAEAKAWVQGQIVSMGMRQALAGIQWHDVTPDRDLAGWRTVCGDWRAEPDGTITARHDGEGTALFLAEPVEGNYEVRGVSLLPGTRALSAAGVYFEAEMVLGGAYASLFSYEAQSGDAKLSGMRLLQTHTQRAWILRENHFHIQVWESQVAAWLDGDLIFRGIPLKEPDPPLFPVHIGIGAGGTAQEGVSAQYRKIEIRRMTSQPTWYIAPLLAPGQQSVVTPPVSRPGYGDDS